MLSSSVRRLVRKAVKPVRSSHSQKRTHFNKVWTDAKAAVADLKDGQTLYVVAVALSSFRELFHLIRELDPKMAPLLLISTGIFRGPKSVWLWPLRFCCRNRAYAVSWVEISLDCRERFLRRVVFDVPSRLCKLTRVVFLCVVLPRNI